MTTMDRGSTSDFPRRSASGSPRGYPSDSPRGSASGSPHGSFAVASLVSRRRARSEMDRNSLQLPKLATETTDSLYHLEGRPTCYVEALPPLGGVGTALMKKMKKTQKWDHHGRCQVEEVEVEVPIKVPLEEGSSCPDIEKGMQSCVVRSGFHRLVYQKARYLREEHGNTYNCFQQAARDMVNSVSVCMKVTDIGRDFKKAVTKPDDEALHIDVNNEGEARRGEVNGDDDKCLYAASVVLHVLEVVVPALEETAGRRRNADEDWKALMDDLNLTPKIPTSKPGTKRSRTHQHRRMCAVKSTPSELENMKEERDTLVA